MVWILDDVYDTQHRAYMMREKEMGNNEYSKYFVNFPLVEIDMP